MICLTLRELELALRVAQSEVTRRHAIRVDHFAKADFQWDDDQTAFAEQAVAEAEIRATEARSALANHAVSCGLCALQNPN